MRYQTHSPSPNLARFLRQLALTTCCQIGSTHAQPTCPLCTGTMEAAESGYACIQCNCWHTSEGSHSEVSVQLDTQTPTVSTRSICEHEGACACPEDRITITENDRLLVDYGPFLTNGQLDLLTPYLQMGRSITPLLTDWGILHTQTTAADTSPTALIEGITSWPSESSIESDSFSPESSEAKFVTVPFSAADFIQKNGGSARPEEALNTAENHWNLFVSSLLSKLFEYGVSPDIELEESANAMLSTLSYTAFDGSIMPAKHSVNTARYLLAITNGEVIYFHGVAIHNTDILYFVPGSGVFEIDNLLLQAILSELELGGSEVIMYRESSDKASGNNEDQSNSNPSTT